MDGHPEYEDRGATPIRGRVDSSKPHQEAPLPSAGWRTPRAGGTALPSVAPEGPLRGPQPRADVGPLGARLAVSIRAPACRLGDAVGCRAAGEARGRYRPPRRCLEKAREMVAQTIDRDGRVQRAAARGSDHGPVGGARSAGACGVGGRSARPGDRCTAVRTPFTHASRGDRWALPARRGRWRLPARLPHGQRPGRLLRPPWRCGASAAAHWARRPSRRKRIGKAHSRSGRVRESSRQPVRAVPGRARRDPAQSAPIASEPAPPAPEPAPVAQPVAVPQPAPARRRPAHRRAPHRARQRAPVGAHPSSATSASRVEGAASRRATEGD